SGEVFSIGETQIRYVRPNDPHAASTLVDAPPIKAPPPSPLVPDVPTKSAPLPVKNLTELAGKPLGYFAISNVIAKGRTGVVFRAVDARDGKDVALKVLLPEFSKNDDEMQRFIRGMKTVLPLRHPNLVAVYGAGKSGTFCWMAMEYIEGESLTQVIQRIGTAGMLDWRNALRVAVHVGRALDYAQQHAIIHRNITPPNILVQTSDKRTLLGDLMLAKALEGSLAQQITRPGEIVGDLAYMSPERTAGTADVDGRSDLYSLGATIYALLTGRPPCIGAS